MYNFGKKRYELADWLGNVRVVINDKKTPQGTNAGDMTYQAQTISVSDYYPFGMLSRSYSDAQYRFGFNGKENDDEIIGKGRWQDYGVRMYRTDLGRFFSPDPIIIYDKKYPELSSYQYASNRPIDGIDLDGLEHYKIQTSDIGDGKTLIQIYIAPGGLHKPFQVDINNVPVSQTQNDWGYKEIQQRMGTTFVGKDNRLYFMRNGSPVPYPNYPDLNGNLDQWSVHFVVPSLTKNQYRTVTKDVPQVTSFSGSNTGGTPISPVTNYIFNIPESSTNATATFTYNSAGPEINTFTVTDVTSGNILFTGTGTDLAGQSFNVPAGGQVNVSVTGNKGSTSDLYNFQMNVITTVQQTQQEVAP